MRGGIIPFIFQLTACYNKVADGVELGTELWNPLFDRGARVSGQPLTNIQSSYIEDFFYASILFLNLAKGTPRSFLFAQARPQFSSLNSQFCFFPAKLRRLNSQLSFLNSFFCYGLLFFYGKNPCFLTGAHEFCIFRIDMETARPGELAAALSESTRAVWVSMFFYGLSFPRW